MLNVRTTYRKTDKGRAEIESRAYGLDRALRQALIMVSGDKPIGNLIAIAGSRGETLRVSLEQLLAEGYIEPNPEELDRTAEFLSPAYQMAEERERIRRSVSLIADQARRSLGHSVDPIIEQLQQCTTRSQFNALFSLFLVQAADEMGQHRAEKLKADLATIWE